MTGEFVEPRSVSRTNTNGFVVVWEEPVVNEAIWTLAPIRIEDAVDVNEQKREHSVQSSSPAIWLVLHA